MSATSTSTSRTLRILGVDPGSRLTGYGIVDVQQQKIVHIDHGVLRLSNTGGKAVIPLEQRLLSIHEGLTEVITKYRPDILSIERVFFAKNAVSALKLGQARGAAILSGAIHGLQIVEYSPSEVKSAIVGHGQAEKQQVARVLEMMLGKLEFKTSDASDGLALAVCHARSLGNLSAITAAARTSLSSPKKKKMSLAESLDHVVRRKVTV